MNRTLVTSLCTLFLSLSLPGLAHSAPPPAASGWIVGSSTVVGSSIGVVGGFYGGVTLGSTGCSDTPHGCGLAPLASGIIGAGLGGAITTPLTVHLTAKAVGADPKVVLRHVGITAGASAGLLVAGTAVGWAGPQLASVAGFAIAIPVVAGFSTATSIRDQKAAVAWSVAPQISRHGNGFVIHGTF